MALTDKCLGARWWAFASLDKLEGVRLRAWRGPADGAVETETDPELQEEMERVRSEKYGDGAVSIGENPMMLSMVIESEEVDFEVVSMEKFDTASEQNQAKSKRLPARALKRAYH